MPSYEKEFIDCIKTIEYYEARQKKATGYNKYMLGRRESDFVYTYTLQRMNIHTSRLGVSSDRGDYVVCSCGLKYKEELGNEIARGHLYNGELTQQVIFYSGAEYGWVYFCQCCLEAWPIISKGEYKFYGIPDVDVEATLAQHSTCESLEGEIEYREKKKQIREARKSEQHEVRSSSTPISLPLINQEADEIAFRESFKKGE
jgi:hypothetical protein